MVSSWEKECTGTGRGEVVGEVMGDIWEGRSAIGVVCARQYRMRLREVIRWIRGQRCCCNMTQKCRRCIAIEMMSESPHASADQVIIFIFMESSPRVQIQFPTHHDQLL